MYIFITDGKYNTIQCIHKLEKLQKRVYRITGPTLAASLEPLGHRKNVASLSLSIGITLVP